MRTRVVLAVLSLTAGWALVPGPALGDEGTASLSGTVTSADGEPLEGVCVDVFADEPVTARTDAAGAYRLGGLPEGGYFVTFNMCEEPLAGHAAEYYDDAPGFREAELVEVQEGQARTGIDAALEPAATIRGTVTDEDSGDGLAGDCVIAFDLESGLIGFVRTGADGGYAMENLRGGEYTVVFGDCSDPFNHMTEVYEDQPLDIPLFPELGAEPTTVTVEDGEEAEGVDAALTEGGSLRGTITTLHAEQPVDGVCVALFPEGAEEDSAPQAVAVTGFLPDGTEAPGSYVFGGVPPGEYVVGFNTADVCGDDGYAEQWAHAQDSRDTATPLTVEQGEVTEGVDAVMTALPSIGTACFSAGGQSRFPDVDDDSAHAPAIECIASYGIVSGRADGTYGPGEPVRREQMATFVAGALGVMGVDVPEDAPDAFSDDDSSVHELAIDQLAALGVVTGTSPGRYAPSEVVTRGQMATFLMRAYERATEFSLRAAGNRFGDDDGTTHEASIDKAATAGLTAGRADGTYRPAADVPRDQMATFVARTIDRVQRDLGLGFGYFVVTIESSEEPTLQGALLDPRLRRLPPALLASVQRPAR